MGHCCHSERGFVLTPSPPTHFGLLNEITKRPRKGFPVIRFLSFTASFEEIHNDTLFTDSWAEDISHETIDPCTDYLIFK